MSKKDYFIHKNNIFVIVVANFDFIVILIEGKIKKKYMI